MVINNEFYLFDHFPETTFSRADASEQPLILQFTQISFDGTFSHADQMRQFRYGQMCVLL